MTFDDGPCESTVEVLEALDKAGLQGKAAFFVVGRNITDNGDALVRLAAAKGNIVGNHSYSHNNKGNHAAYKRYYNNPMKVRHDFDDNDQLLNSILGANHNRYARLPGRKSFSLATLTHVATGTSYVVEALAPAYRLIGWDCAFRGTSPYAKPIDKFWAMIGSFEDGTRTTFFPGKLIIVMHDFHFPVYKNGKAVLVNFLTELQRRGHEFGTINELGV